MQTIISRVSGSSFRTAFALIALFCACLISQQVTAQAITLTDHAPVMEKSNSRDFQAAIHPVANTLRMKVHFVNPGNEYVAVIIKNSQQAVVYRKRMGNIPVFHGSFDLAILPDDTYTIEVRSRSYTYSRSISMQTQQARVVHGL